MTAEATAMARGFNISRDEIASLHFTARLREVLPTDYEAVAIKFAPHHICAAAKQFCFLTFDRGQTGASGDLSPRIYPGARISGFLRRKI